MCDKLHHVHITKPRALHCRACMAATVHVVLLMCKCELVICKPQASSTVVFAQRNCPACPEINHKVAA